MIEITFKTKIYSTRENKLTVDATCNMNMNCAECNFSEICDRMINEISNTFKGNTVKSIKRVR
jgi:hypothetical protein